MSDKQKHPFSGATKKKPTLKHRPAIWENMLGTVYAMNDAGQVKYFDYKWDDARAFAGISDDRDLRTWKAPHTQTYSGDIYIRKGQLVLYVKKEVK